MEDSFSQRKQRCLSREDLSRKGSVDQDIVQLVALLNRCHMFFTTSSCSGRLTIIDTPADSCGPKKRESVWLYVSHSSCRAEDVWSAMERSSGDAVMKFEPLVLHVQCRRTEDAQLLHSVAINSGCRNSGLTLGRTGKITAAVRCSPGLEVPLSHRGKPLVDRHYVDFLTQRANQKMEENLKRIHRLYQNLQACLLTAEPPNLQITEGEREEREEGDQGDQGGRRTDNVYRRKRKQYKQDLAQGCHDDQGSCLPELEDCMDLFT